MSRDHRRLRVFHLSDSLVLEVYRISTSFPITERFGITSQLRRASVSVALNIVEGCARDSDAEYVRFLTIALGSASEVCYLLGLAHRLAILAPTDLESIADPSDELVRSLQKLIASRRSRVTGRSDTRKVRLG